MPSFRGGKSVREVFAGIASLTRAVVVVESDLVILKGNGEFGIRPVNSMRITGTITAKQKVRQKVLCLYAVSR